MINNDFYDALTTVQKKHILSYFLMGNTKIKRGSIEEFAINQSYITNLNNQTKNTSKIEEQQKTTINNEEIQQLLTKIEEQQKTITELNSTLEQKNNYIEQLKFDIKLGAYRPTPELESTPTPAKTEINLGF